MRFLLVMMLLAQSPAVEVASVKPSPPDRPMGFPYRIGPNSLSLRARLKEAIEEAYELKHYQVIGAPAWAESAFYDIQAIAAGEADPAQIRVMLQALLAERFHLKFHRETRTMAGYVLSVDKNGPKLPPRNLDAPPGSKGRIQIGDGIWSRSAPLSQLAVGLTLELEQPVVDRTNIEGNYDFTLRFDDGDKKGDAVFGSVFSALHEFGLKLEAQKIPIEVLVIDSAQKPDPN